MRRLALPLFFVIVIACGRAPKAPSHPHGDHFHMRFERAEEWTRVFDDPARDAWQKPEEVIDVLALAPNARVADIGAGTGYFSVRIARRVPQGVVFAVDVEPDMVRFVEERAKKEGLVHLRAVASAPDDAKIPEPVDLALVVDTYHHIPNRTEFFRKIVASRLAVIDFTRESVMGPPPEHRIPPETVKTELAFAGWREVTRYDFLPNQYFLVFTR